MLPIQIIKKLSMASDSYDKNRKLLNEPMPRSMNMPAQK